MRVSRRRGSAKQEGRAIEAREEPPTCDGVARHDAARQQPTIICSTTNAANSHALSSRLNQGELVTAGLDEAQCEGANDRADRAAAPITGVTIGMASHAPRADGAESVRSSRRPTEHALDRNAAHTNIEGKAR